MAIEIIFLLAVLFIIITNYVVNLKKTYDYWKVRGVAGPKPLPLFGNYWSIILQKQTEAEFLRKIYEDYPNEKYVGIFKGVHPLLVIRDQEILKQVLIKNFTKFNMRHINDPLTYFDKSLFVMKGNERWRMIRYLMSPGFTKSRLLKYVPDLHECLNKYVQHIEKLLLETKLNNNMESDIEVMDLQNKYTLEVIGKLLFGLDLKYFSSDKSFANCLRSILDPRLSANILNTIALTFPSVLSILAPFLKYIINKEFDIFRQFIKDMCYNRKSKDKLKTFLDLLIEIKESESTHHFTPVFDDEDVIQEIMTLCTASYETVPRTMAFMIYELALNQDIQNKCFEEVTEVTNKNNGDLKYDDLSAMKYMDMVLRETMRKHPLSHAIDRKCVSKFTFPDTGLTIDKNVLVYTPVHGLHYDPRYYPKPETFDPERFSMNKTNIPHCVYLPFGEGPRICLGVHMAKIIMLMCISKLLLKFKIQPCEKTRVKLKLDPKKINVAAALDGIWVKFQKR